MNRDRALWELAREYHERTEGFDRTVCTGLDEKGVAIPLTPHERAAINKNAREVLKNIRDKAAAIGFTADEVREAIRDFFRR